MKIIFLNMILMNCEDNVKKHDIFDYFSLIPCYRSNRFLLHYKWVSLKYIDTISKIFVIVCLYSKTAGKIYFR